MGVYLVWGESLVMETTLPFPWVTTETAAVSTAICWWLSAEVGVLEEERPGTSLGANRFTIRIISPPISTTKQSTTNTVIMPISISVIPSRNSALSITKGRVRFLAFVVRWEASGKFPLKSSRLPMKAQSYVKSACKVIAQDAKFL
jgi:hypothetical protein